MHMVRVYKTYVWISQTSQMFKGGRVKNEWQWVIFSGQTALSDAQSWQHNSTQLPCQLQHWSKSWFKDENNRTALFSVHSITKVVSFREFSLQPTWQLRDDATGAFRFPGHCGFHPLVCAWEPGTNPCFENQTLSQWHEWHALKVRLSKIDWGITRINWKPWQF